MPASYKYHTSLLNVSNICHPSTSTWSTTTKHNVPKKEALPQRQVKLAVFRFHSQICSLILKKIKVGRAIITILSWTCPDMQAYGGVHSMLSDLSQRRVWSVLELSQLSMCTDWPGAATCRLVRCWNRSNLVRGQRIPVSRGGHVTGKSGHVRTCRGEIDDVISLAGAAAARYWGQPRRRVAWPLGADTHGHVRGVL